jgi:hypothetical protein
MNFMLKIQFKFKFIPIILKNDRLYIEKYQNLKFLKYIILILIILQNLA